MPKEINNLQEFLSMLNEAKNVSLTVKKAKKKGLTTKLKAKTNACLYTFKLEDEEKLEKIKKSIPPGIKIVEI